LRASAVLAALAVLCAVAIIPLRGGPDAGRTRRAAAVRAIGIADLCLSSDARWLRHPSLSEPAAALHDLPAAPDAYPAGMVLAPPVPLHVAAPGTGGRVHVRR